ncbi:MAG TPA: Smr/MutS family protein [Anaeromyxobacteraceae bacterium]|nr:Smr/MutS family protein [Anaeromyxobacteraceae bacterium]
MARKPFNNPFGKVRLDPPPRAAPPSPAPPPAAGPPPSDEELWAREVAGARPLEERDRRVGPRIPRRRTEAFHHPDLEALRELEALVSGEAPFDIADTDEYVEGHVSGLDPALVRKLRRGEYSVQGHADLHGLTREEARREVRRFLEDSRRRGRRCVLLVHGRGLHSEEQVPVLKEALRAWLATARFGRHVLAFATARPQDGGAGALYVLLRRSGR